ncbi:MAG: hypothetical protein WCQ55_03195 [Paludibacteraceae bacterium]
MKNLTLCRRMFAVAFFLTVLMNALSAKSFFVNGAASVSGSGGDWSSPFLSITQAVDSAAFYTAQGVPVNIYVARGYYEGSYLLSGDVSVVGGLPNVSVGADTVGAQPDLTVCSGVPPVFRIGAGAVSLSGLKVVSSVSADEAAILCESSSFVRLVIRNSSLSGSMSGVLSGESSKGGVLLLDNCDVRDNRQPSLSGKSAIDLVGPYSLQIAYPSMPDTSHRSASVPSVGVRLFYHNESKKGGAISMSRCKSLQLENAWFLSNRSVDDSEVGGGAVFLDSVEYVEVKNSYFSFNRAANDGGAFFVKGSELHAISSTFFSNDVGLEEKRQEKNYDGESFRGGGAVYAVSGSSLSFSDVCFRSNGFTAAAYGGAVAVVSSLLEMSDCAFFDNRATYGGGALFVYGDVQDSSRVGVENSSFVATRQTSDSPYGGGALFSYGSNVYVQNSLFSDNSARRGGALFLFESFSEIYSSTISSNLASTAGGGVVFAGMLGRNEQAGRIANSTISGNSSLRYAGAIGVCGKAHVDLLSNTIVSNASASSYEEDGSGGVALVLDAGMTSVGSLPGYVNVVNTILSGNEEKNGSPSNLTARAGAVKRRRTDDVHFFQKYGLMDDCLYSTLGDTIYRPADAEYVTCATFSDASSFGETVAFDASVSLFPLGYYASVLPCMPFRDSMKCLCDGMPLDNLAAVTNDVFLKDQLMLDQRGVPRGARCSDKSTYQGAVEGGRNRDVPPSFFLSQVTETLECVNGRRVDPAVSLSLSDVDNQERLPLSDLQSYFFMTVSDGNGNVVPGYNLVPLSEVSGNPFLLKGLDAGTYSVIVGRSMDGSPQRIAERASLMVEIPDSESSELEWTGSVSSNWNEPDNWQDYRTKKAVEVSPDACSHVYVGDRYRNEVGDSLPIAHYPDLTEANRGANGYHCANLYFKPGGSVGHIANLGSYDNAYVSMPLRQRQWQMLSAPLKNMYPVDYRAKGVVPQLRYFRVADADSFRMVGDWSEQISTDQTPLSVVGMGYACAMDIQSDVDSVAPSSISFPNGCVMDERKRLALPCSGQNRFLVEDDNGKFLDTLSCPVPQFSGQIEMSAQKRNPDFLMVGNPYMSHIDFNAFYETNKDLIYPQYKAFRDGTFRTYMLSDGNSVAEDGAGRYVPPMSSFVVMLRPSSSHQALRFVSDRVCRTPVPFSKDTIRDGWLKVSLSHKGLQVSSAWLGFADGATDAYSPEEDALKLFSPMNCSEIYTQANNRPLSVNMLDKNRGGELRIPVNIKAELSEPMEVTITGAMEMKGVKLSLYKADEKQYVPIEEDEFSFRIDSKKGKNMENRYFLCFDVEENKIASQDATEDDDRIHIVCDENCVIVTSALEPITSVRIYSMDGRMIYSKSGLSSNFFSRRILLDAGVVVVKASTDRRELKAEVTMD